MLDPSLIPPDMQAELDALAKDTQQIVDTFLRQQDDESPVPEIIYHYTNAAGLKGILESGILWLSDLTSLNDPSEIIYGFMRALPILQDRVASLHKAGQTFTKNAKAFAESGVLQKIAHFFVCSFSSQPDDLSQWRAYADQTKGYAIGFAGKPLEDAFTHHDDGSLNSNRSTFPIRYDDAKLRQVHTDIVDRMARLILLPEGRKDLSSAAINSYMNELMLYTLLPLLQVVLSFKHDAYVHECEFRFLETHRMDQPPEVKLRIRSGIEVRYREFDWRSRVPEALVEIRVGPGANFNAATQQIKASLPSGSNAEIVRSSIPFRNV
jgi:hypothetical protein